MAVCEASGCTCGEAQLAPPAGNENALFRLREQCGGCSLIMAATDGSDARLARTLQGIDHRESRVSA
jgi:hypothetical protein